MSEYEMFSTTEFSRPILNEEILRSIGRGTCFSINYKVTGFWSSGTITLYIQNSWYGDQKFSFTISNSSGGRDTDEAKLDEDAYKNKAIALIDACDLVKELKNNIDKIEKYHEEYKEELRIQREKEQEERRKLEEADPLINEIIAKSLVKDAMSLVKDNYKLSICGISFMVCRPGDKHDCMKVYVYGNKLTVGNKRIGQRALIERLTKNMSWSSCKEARNSIFEQVKNV